MTRTALGGGHTGDWREVAEVERGWLSISSAAKYAGLNPAVLMRAALTGELEAHEKPVTYEKAGDGQRHYWITKREFVDAWLCSRPTPKEAV